MSDNSHDRLVLWEDQIQLHISDTGTGEEETEIQETLLQVDEHLSAGDVLYRIELAVAKLVEDAVSESPPTLQLASRAKRHIVCRDAEQPSVLDGYNGPSEESPSANDLGNRNRRVIGLQDQVQTRCLFSNQAAGALPFARSEMFI
jgi:hypothetical protein